MWSYSSDENESIPPYDPSYGNYTSDEDIQEEVTSHQTYYGNVGDFHKILILGDNNTTDVIIRYVNNKQLNNEKIPPDAEFYVKSLLLNGRTKTLQLWDISIEGKANTLTSINYRNAVGAVIVVDLINNSHLESVSRWRTIIDEHISLHTDQAPIPAVLLVIIPDTVSQELLEKNRQTLEKLTFQYNISYWKYTTITNQRAMEKVIHKLVEKITDRLGDQYQHTAGSFMLSADTLLWDRDDMMNKDPCKC